jgi:Amt family ammonium transporter
VACVFKKYIMRNPNGPRVDFGGLSNGILAGLVAITASNHCVEAWAALVIGSIGGIIYCLGCKLLEKLEIDDPLEVT